MARARLVNFACKKKMNKMKILTCLSNLRDHCVLFAKISPVGVMELGTSVGASTERREIRLSSQTFTLQCLITSMHVQYVCLAHVLATSIFVGAVSYGSKES